MLREPRQDDTIDFFHSFAPALLRRFWQFFHSFAPELIRMFWHFIFFHSSDSFPVGGSLAKSKGVLFFLHFTLTSALFAMSSSTHL